MSKKQALNQIKNIGKKGLNLGASVYQHSKPLVKKSLNKIGNKIADATSQTSQREQANHQQNEQSNNKPTPTKAPRQSPSSSYKSSFNKFIPNLFQGRKNKSQQFQWSSAFRKFNPKVILSKSFKQLFYYILLFVFVFEFAKHSPSMIKEYRIEKRNIALEMQKVQLEKLKIQKQINEMNEKKQKIG